MSKVCKPFFLLGQFLFFFNFVQAQVGVYDAGFGSGGKVLQLFNDADVTPKAVVVQSDGKLVVGGSGGDFFEGGFRIVRYLANGSIDLTFGDSDVVTFPRPTDLDILESLALQPDGKILAGGVTQTTDSIIDQTDADRLGTMFMALGFAPFFAYVAQ